MILRDFFQFQFFHCNCDTDRDRENREFFSSFSFEKRKGKKNPLCFLACLDFYKAFFPLFTLANSASRHRGRLNMQQ